MRISIITVCKNSENSIRKTIESVLKQTYKNIEYIIIDGLSTDNTLSIVNDYISKGFQIKLVSEEDYGIYNAMNKGIKLASGDYIGLLNSDDFYEINAVENIVNNLKKEEMQIAYGMTRVLLNGEEEQIIMHSHRFLERAMICHQSIFVSKKVYNEIGLYNEDYKYVADYDFLLKAKKHNKVVFTPIYKIVVNYNSGGLSMSKEGKTEYFRLLFDYRIITGLSFLKNVVLIKMRK